MTILARLFILVAIAVLPALAIEGYNQFDLRQEREREVRRDALRLATFASGELDRIVESGAGLLSALSRLPAVRNFDAAACSSYLADVGAGLSAIPGHRRDRCRRQRILRQQAAPARLQPVRQTRLAAGNADRRIHGRGV